MNFAAMHPKGLDGGTRQRHSRMALGIAVSLALHALLLSGYLSGRGRPAADDTPEPRTLRVWLRPPSPPVPLAEPAPAAPPAPARQARTEHRKRPHRRPAVAPQAAPPAPGPAEVRAAQEVVEQAKPHFDLEAARKFARRIATERDPARADTAVGQFPEKPYQTESTLARAMSSAHRRNCKDGLPGGLLAPLFLLLEKKDSGCKW